MDGKRSRGAPGALPRPWRTSVLLAACWLLAGLLPGCAKEEAPETAAASPPVVNPTPAPAPAPAPQPEPEPEPEREPEPPPPPPKPLPEATKDWQPDDFVAARKRRDGRLLAAIQERAATTAESPEYAGLWRQLIATRYEPPPPRPTVQPGDPASLDPANADPAAIDPASIDPGAIDPGAIDPAAIDPTMDPAMAGMPGALGMGLGKPTNVPAALIHALGANSTPEALQGLTEILQGKLSSELDPKLQTQMAVRAMSLKWTPAREEFLFQLLTAPQDAAPAAALTDLGLQLLDSRELPDLRRRLAEALPTVAPERRQTLLRALLMPRGDNLPAATVIYLAPETDDELRERIQEGLAGSMHAACLRLFGWHLSQPEIGINVGIEAATGGAMGDLASPGDPAMMGGMNANPLNSKSPLAFPAADATILAYVPALFRSEMQAEVERKMTDFEFQGDDYAALRLATAMPSERVRPLVYNFLKSEAARGPGRLKKIAFFQGLGDPGLLAAIKDLPRADRPIPKNSAGNPGFDPAAADPTALEGQPIDDSPVSGKEAEYQWQEVSLLTVIDLMVRAHNAKQEVRDDLAKDLAVKFPKDVQLVTGFEFDGARHPAGVEAAKDVVVRYASVTQQGRMSQLHGTYGRQLRSGRRHDLANGYWYESVVRRGDKIVSVDLLVTSETSPNPEQHRLSRVAPPPVSRGRSNVNAELPVAVFMHLLEIEVPDYKTAPTRP